MLTSLTMDGQEGETSLYISKIAAGPMALLEAADTAYFRKLLIEDMLGTKENIPIICYTDSESLVQCNDLL